MESIGCEDLDVIVGVGYAAARAALSAQEGGARVLATTPPYRRHLPHRSHRQANMGSSASDDREG